MNYIQRHKKIFIILAAAAGLAMVVSSMAPLFTR